MRNTTSKRSPESRAVAAMMAYTREAPELLAGALMDGIVLAPPEKESAAPAPAKVSRKELVLERILLIAMRAKLSGLDRRVLDLVTLKVYCGRRGLTQGLVTAQTAADTLGCSEQAARLSFKRLKASGLCHLVERADGRGARVVGAMIHHSILTGQYVAPEPAKKPTRKAKPKKIFLSAPYSPPPNPPASLPESKLLLDSEPAARREIGNGTAELVTSILTDASRALAAAAGPRPQTRPRPRQRRQGIQQRALAPPLRFSG